MRFSFGGMPMLFYCCALLLSQPTHAQTVDEQTPTDARPEASAGTTWRNLSDIGHDQGLHPLHAEDIVRFRLPLPLDVEYDNPRIDLRYAVPVLAEAGATLKITINGVPRELISIANLSQLSDDPPGGSTLRRSSLTLPLSEADLDQPFVDVSVSANWYATETACSAPARQRFFRVLPETAVVYELKDQPRTSIRGFLTTLPEEVRMYMDPWLGPEAVRAAWLLTRELKSRGHTVDFVGPGEPADVLISTRESLAADGRELDPEHDLELLDVDDTGAGQQLAIVEPYHIDSIAGPWASLLAAEGYGQSLGAPLEGGATDRFALQRLGADVSARTFRDPTEWTFRTDILPTGRAPSALRLDMVVPPSDEDAPLVLYILQNNVVRGLQTLPSEGGHHSLTMPLNEAGLYSKDPVRIVLKGQTEQPCEVSAGTGYAQLLETSALETVESRRTPETVAEFARGVGGAFSIHLPGDALGDPAAWVQILASIGNSLGVDPRAAEFNSVSLPPVADRPFIWLGPEPPEGFSAPIAFDQGRIQVRDRFGSVLLDSQELPGIHTASLVRNGDQRGLWLRTFEGVPDFPPGAQSATGDLVFGDQRGVLVAIDTRNDAVASVAYPERTTWMDKLASHRGWIFAAAWLLLTVLAVLVARKMRKNSL